MNLVVIFLNVLNDFLFFENTSYVVVVTKSDNIYIILYLWSKNHKKE